MRWRRIVPAQNDDDDLDDDNDDDNEDDDDFDDDIMRIMMMRFGKKLYSDKINTENHY